MMQLESSSTPETATVREATVDGIGGRMMRLTFPTVEGTYICSWRWNQRDVESQQWFSLDLFIGKEDQLEKLDGQVYSITQGLENGSSKIPLFETFFAKCAKEIEANSAGDLSTITFILPRISGYTVQSDVISHRTKCCDLVAESGSFLTPCGPITAASMGDDSALSVLAAIACSAGALLVRPAEQGDKLSTLEILQRELVERLSFNWISLEPVERKRIMMLGGRVDYEQSRRLYESAFALGIDLVVFDRPDHWIEPDDSPYAHLREAFIGLTQKLDGNFPQTLANIIREYPKKIDGVVTFSDALVAGVAAVAGILDFPTEGAAALSRVTNKYQTRAAEEDDTFFLRLSSLDALKEHLASTAADSIPYPLVVKPCIGWNSEGVTKVNNEAELLEAAQKAWEPPSSSESRFAQTDVLIEEYIDGPEVDVNFALWNGEVIFCQICDNFPASGDSASVGPDGDFAENISIHPSCLPENEQNLLETSVLNSIKRLGLSNGVYHCEARVRNSAMAYTSSDTEGLELRTRPTSSENSPKAPSVYLHEINPRAPGFPHSDAIDLTYAVNFFALQLLSAIGDEKRFRTLAQTFSLNRPQHTCTVTHVNTPDHKTVIKDPVAVMHEQRPDLMHHAVEAKTFLPVGTRIDIRNSNASDLACFLVCVKGENGREEGVKIGKEIITETLARATETNA